MKLAKPITYHVKLEADLAKKVREAAESDSRTIHNFIILALKEYVKEASHGK